MSTSKSDTARANGAKSRGPVTPEGKAKSASNSLRHGLSSRSVVLPSESREEYEALLDAHVERFQPADPIERDLVEAMAVARWRLRRIATIETHMLGNAMSEGSHNNASQDRDQHLARVFKSCAVQIALLTRYESSLNRTFDRALRQLQLLQKSRPSDATTKLQNEPKPARPLPEKSPPVEPSAAEHRNLTSTPCPTSVSPSDPCSPNPRGQ